MNNLIRSRSAAYLAVRRVSAMNRGKLIPGIDGIVWNTPELKEQAIKTLRNLNWKVYKASPVKRMYFSKASGEKSLIEIPTRIDRAVQSLWQRALDPIAECGADQNSYGFRKSRSPQDAAQRIFLLCSRNKGKPKWVRFANIDTFYDQVDHSWIENNIPIQTNVLKQWLKTGTLRRGKDKSFAVKAGVPQSGYISSTIANMALDGLEDHLKDNAPCRKEKGKPKSSHIHVIRYTNEFIVTAGSRDVLEGYVKPKVTEFLRGRNLRLSMEKLSIKEIDQGFDFLGFRIGRYTTRAKSKSSGKVFLIKPMKRDILRLHEQLRSIVKDSYGRTSGELIAKLNPILRGWAEYYKGPLRRLTVSLMNICGK